MLVNCHVNVSYINSNIKTIGKYGEVAIILFYLNGEILKFILKFLVHVSYSEFKIHCL